MICGFVISSYEDRGVFARHKQVKTFDLGVFSRRNRVFLSQTKEWTWESKSLRERPARRRSTEIKTMVRKMQKARVFSYYRKQITGRQKAALYGDLGHVFPSTSGLFP